MPPTPNRRSPWRSPWTRALRNLAFAYGGLATLGLAVVLAFSDGHVASYVLGLFATWWLAPSLLLLPIAVAVRSWRVVAAVLAPAVAAGALVGPYALNRLTPSDAVPDLRIATFNTTNWQGTGGLERLVAGAAPDVLALQEIAPSQQRGYEERFESYPYRSYTPTSGGVGEGDGDAVWSKYPIVSVTEVTGLPAGARPADVVVLDVDGRRLAVLSVHLASPCLFCAAGKAARNPAGNTANAARVRVGEAERFAELAASLRAEGTAVVVAGDLNSAELNEPLRALRSADGAGLVDAHRSVGTTLGLTRGSSPGFARVDVVLVAGLEPVATSERDPGGSTHSPVVADLAWPR